MRTTPSDKHVEMWISSVLRTGVISAAGVVFAGAIVYLAAHAGEHVTFSHFHGVEAGLDSVHGVIAGALSGRSEGSVARHCATTSSHSSGIGWPIFPNSRRRSAIGGAIAAWS